MVTPETKPNWWRTPFLWVLAAGLPLAAQVPEPETVFYGRIVNRTTAQEFLMTTGVLEVTVTGEGGPSLVVTTAIQSYAGGKYSYVLRLPHQAKSLDLDVDGGHLPLRVTDTGFENTQMKVNGHPARPFGIGVASFSASQARRGNLHRLDLEVFNDLADTDKDGLPDWWEDLYGLDKQDADDALLRWGNNRFTYLEAFQRGLNPRADDRLPELLTTELVVMEAGATGLLPRTEASISTPSQITYRLTRLPEGGTLVLRNARPDPRLAHRDLKLEDTFTQAEVNAGRLEFVHRDALVRTTRFGVALTNNNPDLAEVVREVELRVFAPEAAEGRPGEAWLRRGQASDTAPAESRSAAETWRLRATEAFAQDWNGGARLQDWIGAFLLARWHGYTVWDGSVELPVRDLKVPSAGLTPAQYQGQFLPLYGRARSHVIFAGHGQSRIEGGMSDDVLVAGRGDCRLRGHGGGDLFVPSEKRTIVEDFKPGEGDGLDLSPLLKGWPGALAEKVQVAFNAGNTVLRIPLSGSEGAEVVLLGLDLSAARLEALRRQGRVFTGNFSRPGEDVNRAPMAVADVGYVTQGETISIAVLSNDRDPDGDALQVTAVTQGEFGSVVLSGHSVLYLPGAGFAGEDRFTYTVSDGRGGFADGTVQISYPFPAAAGRYLPLILDGNGVPVGQLQLTLLRSGAFSVTLKLRGVNYSGKGVFAPDGKARLALNQRGRVVELALALDFSTSGYPLSATLTSGEGEVRLAPSLAMASARQGSAQTQRYTISLDAPTAWAGVSGHGYAAVVLNRNLQGRIVGRLADGTAFTGAAPQDIAGRLVWSRDLYRGEGWLVGRAQLSREAASADFTWSKSTEGMSRQTQTLMALASPYNAPSVAGVSALDFRDQAMRNAELLLTGGAMVEEVRSPLVFGVRDAIRSANSDLSLRLNRANGVLTGKVRLEGISRPVHGVVHQGQNTGRGFFLNGEMAGAARLLITP